MITILEVGFTPSDLCWLFHSASSKPLLAVASADPALPHIYLFDVFSTKKRANGTALPLEVLKV